MVGVREICSERWVLSPRHDQKEDGLMNNMCRALSLQGLLLLIISPAWAADDEPTAAGKKASEWLNILRTAEKPESRRAALLALEIIGPSPRGVLNGINIALQGDKDERVRINAAQLLGKLAVKAQDAKVE